MVNFHELFEISLINADTMTQITRRIKIDKPENSSLDALKITGNTIDDLKKGKSKFDVVNEIDAFINEDGLTPDHRCLVGHNIINFDRKFLWHLWESCGKEFPFHMYLDTMHMMRDYTKKLQMIKPKINLAASCEMLKVANVDTNWHSAKGDTRNCFFLWKKLMDEVNHLMHIKTMVHSLNA